MVTVRMIGVLVGCLLAADGLAQTIDRYRLQIYLAGGAQPVQTQEFPATAVVCGQTPPPTNASTVNPTKAVWTDPADATRVCLYTAQAGDPLLGLPVGSYEATLVAVNAAGASPESNRAPFSRLDAPSAPAGLRLVR